MNKVFIVSFIVIVMLVQSIAVFGLENSRVDFKSTSRITKSLNTKSVETHGVVLPDFKPTPSSVARERASKNAVFKRTDAKSMIDPSFRKSTKSIIDPLFKPAGKKSIIDPSFKPTETKGLINPSFKPTSGATGTVSRASNRATGAVGLESSMKNRARFAQMPVKKQSVGEKGMIDPSFKPTETKGIVDPHFKPAQ